MKGRDAMKRNLKRLLCIGLFAAVAAGTVAAFSAPPAGGRTGTPSARAKAPAVRKDGVYYSRDQVAQYIRVYGCLPTNFITKAQARALGWQGGPLERYAPGKSIGGDRFGNYEGRLPRGGSYRECDIDTLRRPRGAKRIIYTPQRQIYYTEDHYRTFRKLD